MCACSLYLLVPSLITGPPSSIPAPVSCILHLRTGPLTSRPFPITSGPSLSPPAHPFHFRTKSRSTIDWSLTCGPSSRVDCSSSPVNHFQINAPYIPLQFCLPPSPVDCALTSAPPPSPVAGHPHGNQQEWGTLADLQPSPPPQHTYYAPAAARPTPPPSASANKRAAPHPGTRLAAASQAQARPWRR